MRQPSIDLPGPRYKRALLISASLRCIKEQPAGCAQTGAFAGENNDFQHAVVWIDHQSARINHFNAESSTVDVVKTHSNQSHVHTHDPAMTEKSVGVETLDHPTDPKLLVFAKKYFLKVDAMRGVNF